MTTNKKTIIGSLQLSQIGSILDVLYERGISYMRLKDYLNTTSTCSRWRNALTNNNYRSILRDVHLMSTSLLQRFVCQAQEIDRSNSPKFYIRHIMTDSDPIEELVPQSQKDYEIQKLQTASQNSNGLPFDKMSDEDRKNLLDVVDEISLSGLINSEEIKERSIGELMILNSAIKGQYPKLESTLLRSKILVTEGKIDYRTSLLKKLIYLFCLVFLGCVMAFYRQK